MDITQRGVGAREDRAAHRAPEESAMPMRPNFDSPLQLHHGNTRVATHGPLNWDDVRGNCRVDVTITQIVNGQKVSAAGQSGGYDDRDPTWEAEARTNGVALQPGTACAKGFARPDSAPAVEWHETVELRQA
jgi:hypothetical protein